MVEVVTNTFDRAWWRTYAATRAARAAQAESMAAPLARLERRATAAGVPTM